MLRKLAAAVVFLTAATVGVASAGPLYFQGFETDASGWNIGGPGGSIVQTPSGGGALGLTAFNGAYYGETHNAPHAYFNPGYGDGGYNFLNGDGVTPPPYPGDFSQSITVYIDTTKVQPVSYGQAYWIDMIPSSVVSDLVGCYPLACSDEHNFRLAYDGSSVVVTTDGSLAPAATISVSGWYTFQNTYLKGALATDLVDTYMNIFDPANNLISSTLVMGNSDGGTLLSSNLAGPGFIWLPVWQDGFSNDVLGIDNVRADTLANVPEPSTVALIVAGILSLFGLSLLRRRQAV